MGLTDAEVLQIVLEPETAYAQPRRGRDQWLAQRGRHAAAYNPVDRVIITVLYNTQEQYQRRGSGGE